MNNRKTEEDRKRTPSTSDCERFESLRLKQNDQLAKEDAEFMFNHIDHCQLGIHTAEALERRAKMTLSELWSNLLADVDALEDPVVYSQKEHVSRPSSLSTSLVALRYPLGTDELPKAPGLVAPPYLRNLGEQQEEPSSRRTFLQRILAGAVTLSTPALAVARDKSAKKNPWIAESVYHGLEQARASSLASPSRIEMLAHLLRPTGIINYSVASDHSKLPHLGAKGYPRDRQAILAFLRLEPSIPLTKKKEEVEVDLDASESIVVAGGPVSNREARAFLPHRDLIKDATGLISQTYNPDLIPYHFVNGFGGAIQSRSTTSGGWRESDAKGIALGSTGRVWQPREYVDSQTRLATDFLIVSRLPHGPNGGDAVLITGGHGAGSEAFRLMLDPRAFPERQFRELFDTLQGKRYFQFVLECGEITNDADASHAHRLNLCSEEIPPVGIADISDLFRNQK